jgi:hypothetical protein
MNASCGEHSQKNIDQVVLFFDLTCGPAYGWRENPLIVWSVR